eukprot:43969_1
MIEKRINIKTRKGRRKKRISGTYYEDDLYNQNDIDAYYYNHGTSAREYRRETEYCNDNYDTFEKGYRREISGTYYEDDLYSANEAYYHNYETSTKREREYYNDNNRKKR